MHWHKPILTDSGGFQVFSLAELRKISEEGVRFASPIDGSQVRLTPEDSMDVQRALGSDIAMCFDDCTPWPATEAQARESMERSMRWAGALECPLLPRASRRRRAATCSASSRAACMRRCGRPRSKALIHIDFPGYAIGGLAVGEPEEVRLPCSKASSR